MLDAELGLVHVCALPIAYFPGAEPVSSPATGTSVVQATGALEKLANECGASRTLVCLGDAVDQILGVIQDWKPSLVVMGSHGRHGVARLVLGSVAEAVVRRSTVPVMVVKPSVAPSKAAEPGHVAPHSPGFGQASGSMVGAVAGTVAGAVAGPVGAALGGLAGAVAGGFAGFTAERDRASRNQHDIELDRTIGVVGGALGAASPAQLPSMRGAYSSASLGLAGRRDVAPAEGPVQSIDEE